MLAALGALGGAGGPSASSSATSGPASSGYDASFQYNGQMNVGKGSQEASASQAAGGLSPALIYAGAGLAAVAVLAYALRRR